MFSFLLEHGDLVCRVVSAHARLSLVGFYQHDGIGAGALMGEL